MKSVNNITPQDLSSINQIVFHQISEGVVVHDSIGQIVHFNQAALNILDLTANQILGKDSLDPSWKTYHLDGTVMSGESHPASISLKTGKKCENISMGLSNSAGQMKWILINSTPVFKKDSKLVEFVVVTFHDMTEQVLQRNKSLIEMKNVTLGEFSAGILHDLNNPISVISGHAQQLIKLIKSNELKQNDLLLKLESIKKMSQQMAKMIISFKNYARDGSHDEMELVNIHDLIDDALEVCRYQLRKNQIQVELNIDDSFNFYCRPTEILQVIVNLVMNSIDALVDATNKKIIMTAHESDQTVHLSVIDYGAGISRDKRENIFQSFYTTKKKSFGLGIGLAHSKKLIESHGGSLQLDDSTEQTRFHILLPIAKNESGVKSLNT